MDNNTLFGYFASLLGYGRTGDDTTSGSCRLEYDSSLYPEIWTTVVDEGEGTRRNTNYTRALVDCICKPTRSPDNENSATNTKKIQTLYEILQHSADRHADKKALGARELLDVRTQEKPVKNVVDGKATTRKKQWRYYKLSPYHWMTYREAGEYATQLGSGMRHLGLGSGDRVLICAPTSREWMLTAFACTTQSLQIVTAYDTLGEHGLRRAAELSGPALVLLRVDKLPGIAKMIKGSDKVRETLKHVVYYCGGPAERADDHRAAIEELQHASVEVHALADVVRRGADEPVEPRPPSPDDTALVMFTSGSTGDPKGVLLSHHNIVSVIGGVEDVIMRYITLDDDETVLAYLPLAHVLEFMVEMVVFSLGLRIGYGSPQTLTNENMVEGTMGDVLELKPSIMVGVPRVWDTIRSTVLHMVKGRGRAIECIFGGAVWLKSKLDNYGLPSRYLDVLFKKVRENLGGRLKIIITGGAPISADTQRLLNLILCPVIQGYGMTEASGLVCVQMPGTDTLNTVGASVPSLEIKLADVEEMGYHARNNQGEIWLRGPAVFRGYLDNEDETSKVLTKDGWLRTGDIGEWRTDGQLAIIDRLKNLVKLAHGEYVALERLESIYKTSLYVDNICVFANSLLTQPVAVVCPNRKAVERWAEDNGVSADGVFASNEQVERLKHEIMRSFDQIAKNNGLARFETMYDIVLDEDEWTPENGCLTAANKLRRKDIESRHQDIINDIYTRASDNNQR